MPRHVKQGRRISVLLSVLSLSLALTGCGSQPEQAQTPAAAAPAAPAAEQQPKRYDMKGKVVAVDKEGKKLTVDHADIPGFMAAMTMPYAVKDGALLDKLAPGDEITAKVVSTGGEYWLEDIMAAPAMAK